jgi:hypothetical protein
MNLIPALKRRAKVIPTLRVEDSGLLISEQLLTPGCILGVSEN